MITAAMRKTTWRPSYAAPTWQAVWAQMHATMADRMPRGKRHTQAPPMTNAEAVAFIRVWRGATTADGPVWYALAAHAYGWDPPKSDALRVDAKQAAALYPMPDAVWRWSKGIAAELDARNHEPPASLAPNRSTFGDPTFYADVRQRLFGDGAQAEVVTNQPRIVKQPPTAVATKTSGLGWVAVIAIAFLLSDKRRSAGRSGHS